MRAILIAVAILFTSDSMLAQQRKQPTVSRTLVPYEPQPCIEFDRMAARLDAVYKVEEISKTEYEEGMKKYADGTSEEGVDYFVGEKAFIGEKANTKEFLYSGTSLLSSFVGTQRPEDAGKWA